MGPERLQAPTGEADRTNLAVIAILCNTHFTTSRGLNKHTERMHGGVSIRRLPTAIPIPDGTTPAPGTNHTPPTTYDRHQLLYGPRNPGTMTEFLNSKYFIKAKKGTSVKEVLTRWSAVTRKMTNELCVAHPITGKITKNFWGEAAIAAEQFLADDPGWMAQLRNTATIATGHNDVFSPTYHGSVTTMQLEQWIETTWNQLNKITTLQKIGKLIKQQVPKNDISTQLDIVSRDVRERIGSSIDVLFPVSIPGYPQIRQVTVDVSDFLSVIHLCTAWADYHKKFWDVMGEENMDKKLIPSDLGDTPVTAQNLAKTINSVGKLLVAKDVTVGGQGINSVITNYTEYAEEAELEVEEISDEEVAILQAHALQVWKISHEDSAIPPSEGQITALRKRNKRLYEKDAKLKSCGRRKCDNRTSCFTYRESQAKKKGSLYIFIKCKFTKGKDETKTSADKKEKKKGKEGNTPTVAIASTAISTNTSKNYTLTDGIMEKYNDEAQKEITLVWDERMSEYRYVNEHERSSPDVDKLSATKWGSYINKGADNLVRPDCLINIKTLKPIIYRPAYTISVQPTGPDRPNINHHQQVNRATPARPMEDGEIDTWTKLLMMEQEAAYELNNGIGNHAFNAYSANMQHHPETSDVNTPANRESSNEPTPVSVQAITAQDTQPDDEPEGNHHMDTLAADNEETAAQRKDRNPTRRNKHGRHLRQKMSKPERQNEITEPKPTNQANKQTNNTTNNTN